MTRLLPFLMMARASGLAGGFLKKAADTLRAASGGPPPPALQLDAAPSWDALQQTLDAQTPAEEVERVYAWFCRERGDVSHFHAYMLRAELVDSSRVSKRLLHAHVC